MRPINFGLGEPDFNTPENIVEAGNTAAREGKTKYSPVGGIPELVKAVRGAFLRDAGVRYEADEIIAGSGSTQLLSNAIQAAVGITGRREVVIVTPCWRKYRGLIKAAGGEPVAAAMDASEWFAIRPEAVGGAVSVKTAAVLLNNPCNPTGYVISEEDLMKIGDLAVANGAYLIYDQVYSPILFEGRFVSMAALGDAVRARTVTIDSCSKRYSMSGYRIGYCGAPADVIKRMKEIQDNTVWCMNMPAQYAAVEALTAKTSQEAAAGMVREFVKRREAMAGRLAGLGLEHRKPAGSFSFFVKVPASFRGSAAFAEFIKKETAVNVNPGTAFECEGYARFTFCCSLDDIREGMDRIERALAAKKSHVSSVVDRRS